MGAQRFLSFPSFLLELAERPERRVRAGEAVAFPGLISSHSRECICLCIPPQHLAWYINIELINEESYLHHPEAILPGPLIFLQYVAFKNEILQC